METLYFELRDLILCGPLLTGPYDGPNGWVEGALLVQLADHPSH